MRCLGAVHVLGVGTTTAHYYYRLKASCTKCSSYDYSNSCSYSCCCRYLRARGHVLFVVVGELVIILVEPPVSDVGDVTREVFQYERLPIGQLALGALRAGLG